MKTKVRRGVLRTIRRRNVMERLQQQLNNGTKVAKKSTKIIPLTDNDVKRIKRELATLKERV
jgi:hypothetical protein